MSRIFLISFLTLTAVFFVGCSSDNATQPAGLDETSLATADKAIHRPFSDFLDTQGTFCFPDGEGGCFDFEPPMDNFLGWTDPALNFNALFEYLGNADAWLQEQSGGAISLGTEITGTVTERPLADGRALIKVNLRATNILAWVTNIETFFLDPLVFGYRVGEVLEGAPPALGDFHLKMRFISPEQNAPLPDIFQLLLIPEPGQELLHLTVNMSATGVLHEGSGFPEGTLGSVKVFQVYPRTFPGGYDYSWTVERIDIRAIGQ